MAFEDVKAEIGIILGRLVEQPEDEFGLEVLLREKLNELRAFNLPLPQDLVDLEAALDRGLTAEARDRMRQSIGRNL